MRAALCLGCFWVASANAAAPLTPQDFAYGMPIMATELAAAYRVQVPVDVYRVSAQEDLGDVRVFNSQGEAVPYAIRRVAVRADSGPAQTLPLFPLHGDPQSGSQGLRLQLDSPNGALRLQTDGRAPQDGPLAQYLIDARTLDAPIAALQLSWPDSSADFSGRLRIESSDDFSAWRLVVAAAPVANLHAGSQQLIENRIEVPNIKAKFYRLSWLGVRPSFEFNEVRAEPSAGAARVNWSTVVVTGRAAAGAPGDYDFDFGARLPLERVNLVLPESNSVYLAEFKSRANEKAPWRSVTRAGVYRVTTTDGQQTNGPIEVPLDHDRYWRVHLAGESNAAVALRLQGSFSPSEIEFLAHGKPPFLLAYGSSEIGAATTDLSMIPSGTLISAATLGNRNALGGDKRIAAAGPLDKRTVLWAVLVMAVAALGTMAARLARGRSRSVPK